MAELLQQLGYNEYLDRNVWSEDDPLSGSQKLLGIGGEALTSTGSSALPLILSSEGAISAGKVPQLNAAGILSPTFFSDIGTFSAEAGENIAKNDALYVKVGTGKLYRAYALASAGDATPSYNFCGFAVATTLSGYQVAVNAGPIVSGFTGLAAGTTYYLGDSANKGGITFGSSASFGGIGKDYAHPVGLALSATELLCFYGGAGYFWNNSMTFIIPSVGASTTATITPNFEPSFYWGTVYMEASDALGGNTTKRIYDFIGRAMSAVIYSEVNGAGTPSIGKATSMTVTPNAGTDTSTLTLDDYESSGRTSLTLKLSNAANAGSGSTNGAVTALIHCVQ